MAFAVRVELPAPGADVNKRPEEFNEEQRAFLRPFGVYNLTEIPLVHEGRARSFGRLPAIRRPPE